MKDQVEQILATVAARHSDRRLHVFDVHVISTDDGIITLGGRALDGATLQAVRHAVLEEVRGARLDDSAVRLLRRHPPAVQLVATSLTGLHATPSFLSELLTQVTNGYPLEVLEEHESGEWCFVRQPDGYLGWVYKPYLEAPQVPAPAGAREPTHVISAPSTWIYKEPRREGDPLSRLAIGTAVFVAERSGDWGFVRPVGAMLPRGWVAMSHLRSIATLPLSEEQARRQMVIDTRRMSGVYYLWGGCTAFGIDCSGLVQLVHRLSGYTIPRDAGLQFPTGMPVQPPFAPGDALFFHAESDRTKIVHVGLSTGGWRMIHSSRSRNGVYEEDLESEAVSKLRARFAGARSFVKD